MFNTRRLCVRPLAVDDFECCLATRKASELSPAECNGPILAVGFDDKEIFRELIKYRDMLIERDCAYHYGVLVKRTGDFVGEVMLFNVVRGIHQNAEIGAIIHSPFRKCGYAREALRGLIRYGFRTLHLHRIEGLADPRNEVSIRMCLDLGFRIECVSPSRIKANGRWRDTVMLGLTRDEV